jgi:WD40 repeat protein/tRNA A-37 threonylcarbamoyl transferase component Bud32
MPPPPVPDRTETLAPRTTKSLPGESPPVRVVEVIDRRAADDPDRYEQIAEHARGGLGRVVRAVDKRLGRTVAVKELLRHGESANEARFLREAMITARLEHPGIVPVHEAGRWPNGDPYYVMKLVEGRTLKELIAEKATTRERLSLLGHVIAIADAVGYAHSQGVIHRDLKPSNVIAGEFGETIVVDWGLARDCRHNVPEPTQELIVAAASQSSGASTISGKVVGTPAYMSPEQARGELVDERADVYAIGAVLYELLSGSPPHHDDTPQATLDRVIAGPPRPLCTMTPSVPDELATIVGKAMARCPDDRYANASELAEDLRSFQHGKLVSAHSYTAWSLVRKKMSQHRGVVAVALASAIALGAVGVESFRRVVAQRNIAQVERVRAEDSRTQAEGRERDLVLLQAVTALRKDPTATLAWLKTYELRDAERAHIIDLVDEAVALGVARHVFRPGDWVSDAVFTPDGGTLVISVRDGSIRAHDVRTGAETSLGKAPSTAEAIVMLPDGSQVITGGTLGEIMAWPLGGGEPYTLVSGGRMVHSLTLSADGSRVLVQREGGGPEIVPLDGGPVEQLGKQSSLKVVVAEDDWSRQVSAVAPNKIATIENGITRPLAAIEKSIQRLIMSPRGDTVLLYDGTTVYAVPFAGGAVKKLVGYEGKLNQAVWAPDQRSVAIGGDEHDIVIVDLIAGTTRQLRGHTDAIYTLQWTRDGRRLLSSSDDGTARVWTVADGSSQILRGHDDDVWRARFSYDERQVATASVDGSVRVWWIDQPGSKSFVEGEPINRMTLDGDLALVRTATAVARWNVTSGHREPLFSWQDQRGLGHGVASPDGEWLVVPHADFSMELRRRTGPVTVLRGHRQGISTIVFKRDSSALYTGSLDGTLRRWDLATGKDTVLLEGSTPIRGFALSKDGRVGVQVGDAAKLIQPDGKVQELGQGGPWCVMYAEFEAVRDRLLMRRCDYSLVMMDGDRLIELPTSNLPVRKIAISPDGSRIATALGDRTVRLHDAETGRVLRTLRGHTDLVLDVAFSPDGTMLATSSYDKTVRLWELSTDRHRVLRGHSSSVDFIAWRGANHVVTGSHDGTLRVWDVPEIELPSVSELAGRLSAATSARIDVDRPTTGNPLRRGT